MRHAIADAPVNGARNEIHCAGDGARNELRGFGA
jgi:hypothetical protein